MVDTVYDDRERPLPVSSSSSLSFLCYVEQTERRVQGQALCNGQIQRASES